MFLFHDYYVLPYDSYIEKKSHLTIEKICGIYIQGKQINFVRFLWIPTFSSVLLLWFVAIGCLSAVPIHFTIRSSLYDLAKSSSKVHRMWTETASSWLCVRWQPLFPSLVSLGGDCHCQCSARWVGGQVRLGSRSGPKERSSNNCQRLHTSKLVPNPLSHLPLS